MFYIVTCLAFLILLPTLYPLFICTKDNTEELKNVPNYIVFGFSILFSGCVALFIAKIFI